MPPGVSRLIRHERSHLRQVVCFPLFLFFSPAHAPHLTFPGCIWEPTIFFSQRMRLQTFPPLSRFSPTRNNQTDRFFFPRPSLLSPSQATFSASRLYFWLIVSSRARTGVCIFFSPMSLALLWLRETASPPNGLSGFWRLPLCPSVWTPVPGTALALALCSFSSSPLSRQGLNKCFSYRSVVFFLFSARLHLVDRLPLLRIKSKNCLLFSRGPVLTPPPR